MCLCRNVFADNCVSLFHKEEQIMDRHLIYFTIKGLFVTCRIANVPCRNLTKITQNDHI